MFTIGELGRDRLLRMCMQRLTTDHHLGRFPSVKKINLTKKPGNEKEEEEGTLCLFYFLRIKLVLYFQGEILTTLSFYLSLTRDYRQIDGMVQS